jgi:hypothetical protein
MKKIIIFMFFISPFIKAQTYDVTSTDQYGNKSKTTVKVDEKKSGLEYKEKNLNQHLNQQSNINKSLQANAINRANKASSVYDKQCIASKAGFRIIDDSYYKFVKVGQNGYESPKKMRKFTLDLLAEITSEEKGNYVFISEKKTGFKLGAPPGVNTGYFPEYEICFKILDDNGKLIIIEQIKDVLEKEELENANSNQVEKDNSIKELKKLKDLFDSGILTKEEYDNAAAPHKKIVLGL